MPRFAFGPVQSARSVFGANGLGPQVTLSIDLIALPVLDGREMGVGTFFGSPSMYTGGSWYCACAENPTLFLLELDMPDPGVFAPGGVCIVDDVGCRFEAASNCCFCASVSTVASRGGVGGRGVKACNRLGITAGDAIAVEPEGLFTTRPYLRLENCMRVTRQSTYKETEK